MNPLVPVDRQRPRAWNYPVGWNTVYTPRSWEPIPYEERQRKPDDLEAREGQRPIAIHALENLAHSDTGIVILRRLLREQLKRVEQGLDLGLRVRSGSDGCGSCQPASRTGSTSCPPASRPPQFNWRKRNL